MSLTNELISQFVKITNDNKVEKKETTVNATVVKVDGVSYVRIDGSDRLTPVAATASVEDNERVTVTIKDHTAIISGNYSSPAARQGSVDDISDQIAEFEIIIADKISVGELEAEVARIDQLYADNVVISNKLKAAEAEIGTITADNVTINKKLTAAEAEIDDLTVTKLDAEIADISYAKIEDLEATTADVTSLRATYADFEIATTNRLSATEAEIDDLVTNKLDAEEAEIKYANIDFANIGTAAMEYFYAQSGLIENVTVGDQTITGDLVGVTISGDLIKGNTVMAEKLVIKGSDGLYYKLNTDGMTVETQQTDENSLNGTIIRAKSITASKISVTDLVAFGATIGGFKITNNAIHSVAKTTIDNTTRGLFLGNDGQFNFGDSNNFVKFYKDSTGAYKLELSASSMKMSAKNQTVEDAIDEAVSVGETAQTAASAAQTAANDALSKASAAQTAASAAQTTANTANTTATTANTNANAANSLLSDLSNDNKLTAVEKQETKKEWDIIVSEKAKIESNATTYGITTEKTAYTTAYDTLSTYITPLLTSLTTTSDIVGTTFRTNFKNYYDARQNLLNAITTKAKSLADAAQTSATTANTNATTANTNATAAKTAADAAKTAADAAKTAADAAQTTANTAQTAANTAQSTANTASTNANTANSLLSDLSNDNKLTAVEKQETKKEWDIIVSEKTKIDANATMYAITTEKTAYTTAYDTLNTYITPLLSSLTTTSDIVGTTFRTNFKNYYDARQNLLNAITTKAKTLADAAQSSATTANSNANTANTNATAAKTAADAAQSTANTAKTAAATAQTAADAAQSTANAAKTAAATAQTTANEAKANATTANNLLADLSNDNKLTAVEKQDTKKEWDIIISEKVKIDANATTYGITTELTAYTTAYDTLNTYITPLLSSLTTTSDIVGTTFRTNFKNYYDARQNLLNAITAKAKTLADSAQTTANTANTTANTAKTAAATAQTAANAAQTTANAAQTTANTANTNANTANSLLADLANDNKLTAVEKQETKKEWDIIVSEKTKIDANATTYGITTELTAYTTAYTTLSTYITPLLSALGTTSDIVGSTFRTNFKNYYDARQNLLNAITAKAKTLADNAQTKANSAATAASTAQTTANTAQTTANTASTNANTANSLLADLANDNKLTAVEKQETKKEWDIIVSEKVKIDANATTYGITTEKTAYATAYSTLSTYITPLLTSLTTTSDIVGTTFRTNFKNYYDARQNLLNAIAAKAKTLADNAQSAANGAVARLNNIDNTVADLDVALDNISLSVKSIEQRGNVPPFRYVRDWLKGSSANTGNHWVEIQVWSGTTNVAAGKTPTSNATITDIIKWTNGNTAATDYATNTSTTWTWLQLDLGSVRSDLDSITVFHHYSDSRKYNTKLEVSADGVTWISLYDSDVMGLYPETALGRTYYVNLGRLDTRLRNTELKVTRDGILATIADKINTFATTTQLNASADAVTLSFKQSGGYNLIRNGNFDQGLYAWTIEIFNAGTTTATWDVQANNDWLLTGKRGLWSMSADTGAKEKSIRQEVPTIVGQTYTLSYYIAGHRSNKRVRIRNGNGWLTIAEKNYGPIQGGTTTTNWVYDSITFVAQQTVTTIFIDYNTIIPTSTNAEGYMWLHDITLTEGPLASKWIPHKEELVNSSTIINGSGVTVLNGALKVLNKAGTTVLSGDANGNLTVTGTITGSTITGGIINGATIRGSDIISPNITAQRELVVAEEVGWAPQIVFKRIIDGEYTLSNAAYVYANNHGDLMLQPKSGWVAIDGNLDTRGDSGWINTSYGGGWRMTDSTWIRTFGGKNVYIDAVLRTDGGFHVGDNGNAVSLSPNYSHHLRGETRFYQDTYSDPAYGIVCAVKISGGMGVNWINMPSNGEVKWLNSQGSKINCRTDGGFDFWTNGSNRFVMDSGLAFHKVIGGAWTKIAG